MYVTCYSLTLKPRSFASLLLFSNACVLLWLPVKVAVYLLVILFFTKSLCCYSALESFLNSVY